MSRTKALLSPFMLALWQLGAVQALYSRKNFINNACNDDPYMIYSISGRETSTPGSKKKLKKELALIGWM
jgi:hypothetical protein